MQKDRTDRGWKGKLVSDSNNDNKVILSQYALRCFDVNVDVFNYPLGENRRNDDQGEQDHRQKKQEIGAAGNAGQKKGQRKKECDPAG